MYPLLRLGWELNRARHLPGLPPEGTHEGWHRCWPLDLDFQMELNNGRALTLYDIGRTALAVRVGLLAAMRREGWQFAMMGGSVRWRHRVRLFDRLRMTSRAVARDARFIYIEQALWRGEAATSHAIFRTCVTGPEGIVPVDAVARAMGVDWIAEPKGWVADWIAADQNRPWPPQF